MEPLDHCVAVGAAWGVLAEQQHQEQQQKQKQQQVAQHHVVAPPPAKLAPTWRTALAGSFVGVVAASRREHRPSPRGGSSGRLQTTTAAAVAVAPAARPACHASSRQLLVVRAGAFPASLALIKPMPVLPQQ
mmetsp:Transcript_23512/g.66517  ORF Transcript_23512/g.66517 Transcript_23512/m.66517 type:complete len:132 (+) Transcript_23512:844-1239(+)